MKTDKTGTRKTPVNFVIESDYLQMIDNLAEKLDLNRSDILRMAVAMLFVRDRGVDMIIGDLDKLTRTNSLRLHKNLMGRLGDHRGELEDTYSKKVDGLEAKVMQLELRLEMAKEAICDRVKVAVDAEAFAIEKIFKFKDEGWTESFDFPVSLNLPKKKT